MKKIWVGLLIEIQPIFIKGISPNKPLYVKKDYYRQMMNVNTQDSSTTGSNIRQKINMAWYYTSHDNFNFDQDMTNSNDQMNTLESRNLDGDNGEYIQVYEMQYEAKSS